MRTIPTNCKICKQPVAAKADECCTEEWIRKLLPAVTCNRCFDIRTQINRAVDCIAAACNALSIAKHERRPDVIAKKRRIVAEALTDATKEYAERLGELRRTSHAPWDPEFVEQLMDHPEQWPLLLKMYRKASLQTQPAKLLIP